MRVVYKYAIEVPIPVKDLLIRIEMPKFAEVVHVGTLQDVPYLWAEVDITEPMEYREFYVVPTGTQIPRPYNHFVMQHVGTFVIVTEGLVFHLYQTLVPG